MAVSWGQQPPLDLTFCIYLFREIRFLLGKRQGILKSDACCNHALIVWCTVYIHIQCQWFWCCGIINHVLILKKTLICRWISIKSPSKSNLKLSNKRQTPVMLCSMEIWLVALILLLFWLYILFIPLANLQSWTKVLGILVYFLCFTSEVWQKRCFPLNALQFPLPTHVENQKKLQ